MLTKLIHQPLCLNDSQPKLLNKVDINRNIILQAKKEMILNDLGEIPEDIQQAIVISPLT